MIKAVLWDFDGTMVDTKEMIISSWKYIFKNLIGKDITEEELEETLGESLKVSFRKFFPDVEEDRALDIYREYQNKHCQDMFKLFPNIREILAYLKSKNIRMAVVTSRGDRSTHAGLKSLGIDEFFEVVITADTVKRPKPDKEPILRALKELNIDREEAVMIGDTNFDIEASHNADVKVGLVKWSSLIAEDDIEKRVDFIIEDVNSLEKILENNKYL